METLRKRGGKRMVRNAHPTSGAATSAKKVVVFYFGGTGLDRMRRGVGLRVRPGIAVT